MKSVNFEILRNRWPDLAVLGGLAEAYAHADPASALVKLRLFAENLTKDIYRDLELPKPEQPSLVDLLENDTFAAITPRVVLGKLHAIRMHANKATHGESVRAQSALWLLKEAHDLARWLCIQYGDAKADQLPAFAKPSAPGQAEKNERRRILEKLAAQEARMGALIAELDVARSKAGTTEKKTAELQEFTYTNTGKFPGTRKIFGSIESSPDVSHANSPQLRAPSVRIRFGELVKSDQTAPTFSLTASAVSKTWLAKWRDFRNWNTVSTGFSSGL